MEQVSLLCIRLTVFEQYYGVRNKRVLVLVLPAVRHLKTPLRGETLLLLVLDMKAILSASPRERYSAAVNEGVVHITLIL